MITKRKFRRISNSQIALRRSCQAVSKEIHAKETLVGANRGSGAPIEFWFLITDLLLELSCFNSPYAILGS